MEQLLYVKHQPLASVTVCVFALFHSTKSTFEDILLAKGTAGGYCISPIKDMEDFVDLSIDRSKGPLTTLLVAVYLGPIMNE